jgi:protein TonB
MRFWLLPALAVIGGAQAAQALSISPTWLQRPSAEDVARVYPVAARTKEVEGFGAFDCLVTPSGLLRDCRVVREGPEGWGFGQAAMSLASTFVVKMPPAAHGSAQRLTIPIRFSLPRERESAPRP